MRDCYEALTPGGVLGVWSAEPNARYEKKLRELPFDVEVLRVPERIGRARPDGVYFSDLERHGFPDWALAWTRWS